MTIAYIVRRLVAAHGIDGARRRMRERFRRYAMRSRTTASVAPAFRAMYWDTAINYLKRLENPTAPIRLEIKR